MRPEMHRIKLMSKYQLQLYVLKHRQRVFSHLKRNKFNDEIRKLALECDYDSSKEDWETKWKRNWVGERTNKLNLDEINNQIINLF